MYSWSDAFCWSFLSWFVTPNAGVFPIPSINLNFSLNPVSLVIPEIVTGWNNYTLPTEFLKSRQIKYILSWYSKDWSPSGCASGSTNFKTRNFDVWVVWFGNQDWRVFILCKTRWQIIICVTCQVLAFFTLLNGTPTSADLATSVKRL